VYKDDDDDRLTGTAGIGRLHHATVRFDGVTERYRLIVEVDVLNGVAETEVGQHDVEQPRERFR